MVSLRAGLLLSLPGLMLVGLGAWAHDRTLTAYSVRLPLAEARRLARGGSLRTASYQPRPRGETCRLQLRLVDAETQQPLVGMVRVTGPDGKAVELSGLVNRGIKLRDGHPAREWYALLRTASVTVPRGRLRIEAVAGLDRERSVRVLRLEERSAAEVTLTLPRFADPARLGWRSGNTHLHLMGLTRSQADEYLQTLPRADGLELLFVSYLERAEADRDYISNQYRPRDLRALSGPDLQFGDGEEHRHNFTGYGEGYGHVMLLQLRELVRPVSIGSGIMKAGPDWPPLRRGIQKARREGATVIWCHNDYGMEDTPNWLAGLVQAHNIFDGGHHGSYRDTFYRYLNLGLKVPFSTGTDWFLYDYSRAYVRLEGPPTAARWLQGLTQGRSYITNSPLLEFRVEEREIGETIRLAGPRSVRVEGRAVGRHDFRQVDVVQNGVVVRSAPSRRVGGHFEAELRFDLPITGPGWLALKVAGEGPGAPREVPSLPRNEFGEALFGHTSPVYLEFAGRTIFQPEAAAGFLREMEQSLRVISEKGQFETSAQREEVLAIYQEAIAGLRRRSEREGRRLPSSDQSGR